MRERNMTNKERRSRFYGLMNDGDYGDAWDYLMKNSDLLDNMKISQLAEYYKKFRTQVSIEKLSGLTRILKEEVFGEDAKNIFP